MLAIENKVDEIATTVRRVPDARNPLSEQAPGVLMQDSREASASGTATGLPGLRQLSELVGSIAEYQSVTVSSRTLVQPAIEVVRSAVHSELQAILHPVLEGISQSEARQNRLSVDVKSIIDTLSTQIAVQNPSSAQDTRPVASKPQDHMAFASDPHPALDRPPSLTVTQGAQDQPPEPAKDWMPPRYTRETWSTWTYKRRLSWIGTVWIEVKRYSVFVGSKNTAHTAFQVKFRPSFPLVSRRWVSLKYTTEPSSGVYYQLAPYIATFHIIPRDAEIWSHIRDGNVSEVQRMLSSGLANPNDQDDDGYTLLHVRKTHSPYDTIIIVRTNRS